MIVVVVVEHLIYLFFFEKYNLTGSLKADTLFGGRAPHAARVTMGGQPRVVGEA